MFRNDATGPVLVAASLGLTPLEEANLVNPQAGEIHRVHPWVNVPGTANFTLFSSLLRTASADNTTVSAPPSATKGATGTIPLPFSGLTPGTKYLGSVAYGGTTGLPNPTIVRVDP